jgi:hypothetical protein
MRAAAMRQHLHEVDCYGAFKKVKNLIYKPFAIEIYFINMYPNEYTRLNVYN